MCGPDAVPASRPSVSRAAAFVSADVGVESRPGRFADLDQVMLASALPAARHSPQPGRTGNSYSAAFLHELHAVSLRITQPGISKTSVR